MVLSRSRCDINQKEAIGNYEFTLTPRALFGPDGTVLPCLDKSKLIHLLEKLTIEYMPQEDKVQNAEISVHQDAIDTCFTDYTPVQPSRKTALIDGTFLVQKLSKNQQQ